MSWTMVQRQGRSLAETAGRGVHESWPDEVREVADPRSPDEHPWCKTWPRGEQALMSDGTLWDVVLVTERPRLEPRTERLSEVVVHVTTLVRHPHVELYAVQEDVQHTRQMVERR